MPKAKLENSQGKVFYGMHFYPGLAEYVDPIKNENFRVYVNEDTIRQMSPSFAGRPVFVEHVDEVEEDLNQLRNEADGWVVESFFNPADGKTWAKFIIVSERGLQAIQRGFRLSNAYIPQVSNRGGLWNGISYRGEVTGGEFEHLAIVQNPRYEESVIMTPEQFKAYNEDKTIELKKLSNSKDEEKGDKKMPLNLFKRTKVENSLDLENTIVELPKSKKEMSIATLVNEMDKIENMHGYANGDHLVKVGEDEMSVNDLVKKHQEMCNSVAEKEKAEKDAMANDGDESDMDDPAVENSEVDDMGAVGDRGGDESLDNEEDEAEKEKAKKEKMKNDLEAKKAKALKLKNAHLNAPEQEEAPMILLPTDMVVRGKDRYGAK